MKESLVSGLNEWLLSTDPKDSRYEEMQALRDTVQGASEDSDLFATVQEYKDIPKPVAKGFAFDFLFNEAQAEQIDWTLNNAPADEKWYAIIKLLHGMVVVHRNPAVVTYGESGGPYNTSDDENED